MAFAALRTSAIRAVVRVPSASLPSSQLPSVSSALTPVAVVPSRPSSGIGHLLPMWARKLPRDIPASDKKHADSTNFLNNSFFRDVNPQDSEPWTERYRKHFLPAQGDLARPEYFSGFRLAGTGFLVYCSGFLLLDLYLKVASDDDNLEYSEALYAKLKYEKRMTAERNPTGEVMEHSHFWMHNITAAEQMQLEDYNYEAAKIIHSTPEGEEPTFPQDMLDFYKYVESKKIPAYYDAVVNELRPWNPELGKLESGAQLNLPQFQRRVNRIDKVLTRATATKVFEGIWGKMVPAEPDNPESPLVQAPMPPRPSVDFEATTQDRIDALMKHAANQPGMSS